MRKALGWQTHESTVSGDIVSELADSKNRMQAYG